MRRPEIRDVLKLVDITEVVLEYRERAPGPDLPRQEKAKSVGTKRESNLLRPMTPHKGQTFNSK